MGLGFGGEVAEFYQRYRRGYPTAVVDALVDAFGLGRDDVVVDIGCGTGQLTLPVAERVRVAIGMDPEPDMLARARQVCLERGRADLCWLLGADTDLPALRALVGDRALGAVTIGQALHGMDHGALFGEVAPVIRDGGGVAVVTNGAPLWQQDVEWSQALRSVLERWLARSLTDTCRTDTACRFGCRSPALVDRAGGSCAAGSGRRLGPSLPGSWSGGCSSTPAPAGGTPRRRRQRGRTRAPHTPATARPTYAPSART